MQVALSNDSPTSRAERPGSEQPVQLNRAYESSAGFSQSSFFEKLSRELRITERLCDLTIFSKKSSLPVTKLNASF